MQRIQYHSFGSTEQLKLESFSLPVPNAQQVTVRVKAASINPVDYKILDGSLKIMTGKKFPRGMGIEFSGIVEAVGSSVSQLQVGDEVFGLASMKAAGAMASQLNVEAKFVAKKPANVSFEQAACLSAAGATAWTVIDKANLQSGQTLFVTGCYGAVGQAAVQIAKVRGVKVTGTCNASVMESARQIGVDEVIDYNNVDWSSLKGRFDAVLDTADLLSMKEAMSLLTAKGLFVDTHPSPGKIFGGLFNSRYKMVALKVTPELLGDIAAFASQGNLSFNIGATAPFPEAIDLIAEVEKGKKVNGKALVLVD